MHIELNAHDNRNRRSILFSHSKIKGNALTPFVEILLLHTSLQIARFCLKML